MDRDFNDQRIVEENIFGNALQDDELERAAGSDSERAITWAYCTNNVWYGCQV